MEYRSSIAKQRAGSSGVDFSGSYPGGSQVKIPDLPFPGLGKSLLIPLRNVVMTLRRRLHSLGWVRLGPLTMMISKSVIVSQHCWTGVAVFGGAKP
jgi:hypothetical protein